MNAHPPELTVQPANWAASPEPATLLQPLRSDGWRRWLAPAIAAAVLAAALYQLSEISLRETLRLVPHAPSFWLIFATWYLVQPATEWMIFRRLWSIPPSGFLALLRKRVSNEILLGYSGEVYFYGWARRNASLVGAPFGAIKDVAILSAATGNISTLVLLGASWPLLGMLHLGLGGRLFALSVGTVALSSVATFLFRRSIFSLPRADIGYISVMHMVRIVLTTLLTAVMWAMVLPTAPLLWWFVLSTMRMLISRLPFVPNKDVIFAGVAVFLMGQDAAIADLLAMMAGLILVTHLLLGAALTASELARLEEPACG